MENGMENAALDESTQAFWSRSPRMIGDLARRGVAPDHVDDRGCAYLNTLAFREALEHVALGRLRRTALGIQGAPEQIKTRLAEVATALDSASKSPWIDTGGCQHNGGLSPEACRELSDALREVQRVLTDTFYTWEDVVAWAEYARSSFLARGGT